MSVFQADQTSVFLWVLINAAIAAGHTLAVSRFEHRLRARSEHRALVEADTDDEYVQLKIRSDRENARLLLLMRMVITSLILTVVCVLPIHPSPEKAPRIGMLLLLMLLFYLKSLLHRQGLFTLAHLSDNDQTLICQDDVQWRAEVGGIKDSAKRWRKMDRLLAFTVMEPRKDLQAPATKALLAVHRQTYVCAFLLGLAGAFLPIPGVFYLCVLWGIQFVVGAVAEIYSARQSFGKYFLEADTDKVMRHIWLSIISFLFLAPLFALIPVPACIQMSPLLMRDTQSSSVASRESTEATDAVNRKIALPTDINGLYFVLRMDGVASSGATARIADDRQGGYLLQVYSDCPTRRYSMRWDSTRGVLYSDVLGDGRVIYNSQYQSIEINFSDKWILTN